MAQVEDLNMSILCDPVLIIGMIMLKIARLNQFCFISNFLLDDRCAFVASTYICSAETALLERFE